MHLATIISKLHKPYPLKCLLASRHCIQYRNYNQLFYYFQVIDGFRHDYLSDYPTPSLDRIINLGVHVPSVVPEFPATTDAFLASLLTGRHTADHGIFAEHIFSEANQTVTDLSQPLLWKHVKSLGTLWVCISVLHGNYSPSA